MRVSISVRIRADSGWDIIAEQDAEVKITPEAAAIMPWEIVCENLVQSALDVAVARLEEEEQTSGRTEEAGSTSDA